MNTTLSAVRDLDYADALSRLSQELFGLDAAQQAFARAQNLSLFHILAVTPGRRYREPPARDLRLTLP